MKVRHAITGATLILVVLFTLLLLAVVLAATMRLGLTSRQNTADQKALLQTQYAAESGMSLIQSRLRDIETVASRGTDGKRYMDVPAGVTLTPYDVNEWARLFCGQTGSTISWSNDPNDTLGVNTYTCTSDPATVTNQKFAILGNLVTDAGYALLPETERTVTGKIAGSTMTVPQKTLWWNSYLNNFNSGSITYNVRPLRAYRKSYTYRFYMGAERIESSITNGSTNSSRKLVGKRTRVGEWWFQIQVPNIFDNALMLNFWASADGGFYDDVIRGNMFTNQNVRFLFSTNKVRFMGDVRSAGCIDGNFPAATAAPGTDCSKKQAGFYGDKDTFKKPLSGTTDTARSSDIKSQMQKQGATFDPKQTNDKGELVNNVADFYARYTPLPLQINNQSQEAKNKGIVIPANYTTVEMYAGNDAEKDFGTLKSTYNDALSRWNEPATTYQYISLKGSAESILYRADANGNLYKKVGANWSLDKTGFNGVLFSDHRLTVAGPQRTIDSKTNKQSVTDDVSKMPPALASFSRINLTAQGGMDLTTDLTASDTPCGFDNKKADGKTAQGGCPKIPAPTNTLALYAPTGNITMTKTTPNEVTYHAAILASQGTFNVADYNTRPTQGKRHVVGAVVEQNYGLNGTARLYNGQVKYLSGYGDDFSQDIRFRELETIPANPIAITVWQFTDAKIENDDKAKGLDEIVWSQGKN